MNWRNVLPFGVPTTTSEVMASFASAVVFAIIGASLVLALIFWIEP